MMTKIIPGNIKRSRWPWPAGALFLFVLLAVMAWNRNLANKSADPLTAAERTWLKVHPVIRLAPDPDFPPVEYFAKGGGYSGITADYVALLEKKLGIRFEIVPLRDWNQIINKAKSRQIDVVVASATPQRAEYMLFTKPFLELPAVIIAREKVRGPLSLEELGGMRVSVVSGYATHDFIAGNFPKLRLDPVPDVRTGLRKVSFGLSDAFVENLATASYYIEKDGIANLRIAGESGYFYRMGFCSRKDWPELNRILEKGLAGVSADEEKAIYKKWIPLEPRSLFNSREFQTGIFVAFGAILMIAAGIIAWNRALARQVRLRTGELENELAERRRVEEKLHFTQFAVDNSIDQAFWMTEDGHLFYVNDAACRTLGYSREELIGMSIPDIDLYHPPKLFARHWSDLREHGAVTMETCHRAKDGCVYPVEVRANHVVFDGKEYNCAFATDISERKRMQEELERARDELEKRVLERTTELARTTEALIAVEQEKSLFLNVTDALVVYFDLEMNILWANRAACESVEMPQEKLQQRHCWEMWHKRREPCTGCPVILARDTGESQEAEMRSPDGRVWFIRSYPVKDKTGRITGMVEFCQDFTERKKMEEELLLSHFCINKAAIGIYHTTPEGNILSANDFACRSLGYTVDELRALKVPDIDLVITNEKVLEITRLLDSTGVATHETVHRRKDGTTFPVEIVTNSLEFQGKSYAFSFVRDITERQRTERVIMARLRLLQFAGTHTLDELLEATLDEAEALTSSLIGFYHFLKADQQTLALQNWSTRTKAKFCKTEGKGRHYDVSDAGAWADCIRERRPVIHNDYAAIQHRKGIPQDHAQVMRELVVPVFRGNSIVAILGVGNKPADYTVEDMEAVALLADLAWEITERKQAVEALREANLVVENSPVVLFRCKPVPGWPVELVSRNVVKFGYEPEEFLSGELTYSSIVYPPDLEKIAAETEEFAATGKGQLLQEYRIVTKKGEIRWIIDETNCERNEEGEITHFEGVIIDVTERKLAEDALREANLVVENSPVMLFRWRGSDEWPVELVSTNIIQFGYEPDEFLSGSITYSSIIHPDDLERVTREVHAFCNEQTDQFQLEYRIITKWGDVRWVNEHTNIERDTADVVRNFEGIVIDVTERKLADEELQQQKQLLLELNVTLERRVEDEVKKNREKDIMLIQQNRQAALGEMLDHIAHQWKQPLNSISLIVQEMAYSSSDGELTDEHVQATNGTIMSLLDHMAQTIDVFRGFYRPDKETKVFSIKESIDQALAFIAPTFRFQSIAVELDVDPELTGFGYPREYTQVLLNILANAKDVFRARGTENPKVTVKAFAESTMTVVTITDNAGGIPEAIIDKIFNFYVTTNKSSGGTGIGLYMSKNIIEKNMGGTLGAENTDSGARFRIEIPPA